VAKARLIPHSRILLRSEGRQGSPLRSEPPPLRFGPSGERPPFAPLKSAYEE